MKTEFNNTFHLFLMPFMAAMGLTLVHCQGNRSLLMRRLQGDAPRRNSEGDQDGIIGEKSFFLGKSNSLWSSCGFQEAPVTFASVKCSDMLDGSRDSLLWRSTQGLTQGKGRAFLFLSRASSRQGGAWCLVPQG